MMKHLLIAAVAALAGTFMSNASYAQCSPGQCTTPWSPYMTHTINLQLPSPASICTYTYYYRYQTRQCSYGTEVRFAQLGYTSNCHVPGSISCSYMQSALLKAFTLDLRNIGESFIFTLDWNCCTTVEIDLSGGNSDFCFRDHINPIIGGNGPTGNILEACNNYCCTTEMTKINSSQVSYTTGGSIAGDCSTNSPNIPNTYLIYCDGMQIHAPVLSVGACNPSCYTGSGIFKQENPALNVATEEAQKAIIDIYPNPAQGDLTIAISQEAAQHQVQIFDLQGRLMLERTMADVANGSLTVDVSTWNTGIYLVKVTNTATGETQDKKVEVLH